MTKGSDYDQGGHNGQLCRSCAARFKAGKSHGCVRSNCSGPCPVQWDVKLKTWMPVTQ